MSSFIQKGLKNILQKNPHDVVFLSALRTPITRAKKGGLRDAYDHEMLAAVHHPMGTFSIGHQELTIMKGAQSNDK